MIPQLDFRGPTSKGKEGKEWGRQGSGSGSSIYMIQLKLITIRGLMPTFIEIQQLSSYPDNKTGILEERTGLQNDFKT